MPGSYTDFPERKVQHLEMIQAVVSRLGTDAFIIKGWAVTVAGAFFGFTISTREWRLALVSAIPTLLFWILDTYFLRSERAFRRLYDAVLRGGVTEPFFMSATSAAFLQSLSKDDATDLSWAKTFKRPTLCVLYGALLVAAIAIAAVVANFLKGPSCPA
jgi:hypothetical protein